MENHIVVPMKSAITETAPGMSKATSRRRSCLIIVLVLLVGPSVVAATAVETVPDCQGAGIDIELCVFPGPRDGTFLIEDGDKTIVASIPSDPRRCPDQTFTATLEYPQVKPDRSVPPQQRTCPILTVVASSSNCAGSAPSKTLRLERSEVRYGLSEKDLTEGFYAPSTASVAALWALMPASAFAQGLSDVRPANPVDSLTKLVGTDRTVAGKPCNKAKRRAACNSRYSGALLSPASYGQTSCGRCPIAPRRQKLVYTRRDDVGSVIDLRAFLGVIDTAADAALVRDGVVVGRLPDDGWLISRTEVDGTCNPLEHAELYESVSRDGRVELLARVLVTRQFRVCA